MCLCLCSCSRNSSETLARTKSSQTYSKFELHQAISTLGVGREINSFEALIKTIVDTQFKPRSYSSCKSSSEILSSSASYLGLIIPLRYISYVSSQYLVLNKQ